MNEGAFVSRGKAGIERERDESETSSKNFMRATVVVE